MTREKRAEPRWRRYVRFWGPDVNADIDDELHFHVEQRIADYERRGLSREEAQRAAMERFGDAKEIALDLRKQDEGAVARTELRERVASASRRIRLAARSLVRRPVFAITAVLTLALGVGFATGVFTIARTLLLEPLPVAHEDELVVAWGKARDGTVPVWPFTMEEARQLSRQAASLAASGWVSYYGALPTPIENADRIDQMKQAQVSGDFFRTVNAQMILGRPLLESDDVVGAEPVAVLSEGTWQRRFGADSAVLGRRVRVFNSGLTYTIVGVVAAGMDLPRHTELWVPFGPTTTEKGRQFVRVTLVGRLAPDRTVPQFRSELQTFYQRAERPSGTPELAPVVESMRTAILGDATAPTLAFAAAVTLLLLITCVNVATLLLLRGSEREQELAVRSALGARRREIVVVLLTEAGLLALIGGIAGLAIAAIGIHAFLHFAPSDLPRLSEIGLGGVGLLAALGISALTMMLFGIAPALVLSRVSLIGALRGGARQSGSRKARRTMGILAGTQITLAFAVLSSAAIITRSLIELQRADLGFDGTQMLVADLTLRQGTYQTLQQQVSMLDGVITAVEAIPGVTSASPVVAQPFSGSAGWDLTLAVNGQTRSEAAQNPTLNVEVVGPDYFRTLNLPLLAGRSFTAADRETTPLVAVLSRRAAEHYWPGENPIGKHLVASDLGGASLTVVGVVPDTRYRDLRDPRATVYFPLHQSQFPFAPMSLVVQTSGPPSAVANVLRETVARTAPGVTVADAQPFETLLRAPLAQPRLTAFLLLVFAGAAVVLAAVGLYGIVASTVRQRTRELAIRMALGATQRAMRTLVLRQGLCIAAAGAAVGAAVAIATSRVLTFLVYGITTTDPLTLLVAAAILMVVAFIATFIPARRVMAVEPALALRADT